MSNPNVVRLSSLDSSRRSNRKRKPKYSIKPWEYKDDAGRLAYYSALVRTNIRHQQIKYGSYSPDRDPHISQLSEREIYALQIEALVEGNSND